MPANPDYKDLFKILNEEKVEYLLVGEHALIFYSEPRYTKYLDILVLSSKKNSSRIWKALKKFGAPLKNITEEDFTNPEMIYQIGIDPNRIDIIMSITGISFEDAWKNKKQSTYDNIPINIISKKDLITAKKASKRPQDLLDVDKLLALEDE